MIASPGLISSTVSKSKAVSALLSDAIIYDLFLVPSDSGRIPFGSRKATIPIPEIRATTEKPPEHFSYIDFKALKTCDVFSFLKFVLYSS